MTRCRDDGRSTDIVTPQELRRTVSGRNTGTKVSGDYGSRD